MPAVEHGVQGGRGEYQYVKRKATRRELDEGVQVDESGYKLPNTLLDDSESRNMKLLHLDRYEYRTSGR
jgi:hypothetical protein